MTPPEQIFEQRLYRHNRPIIHWLFQATRTLGPVVSIPRVGRLVNDAMVARAILLDTDHFNSHGPGSFGALITQALGPNALINMDGPAHQAYKRALLQVFSHRYVAEVVAAFGQPMVEGLRARLIAGETVDFAAFMRDYGGAMACALIGVPIDRADAPAEHDDIFRLATEIMAFAGDGKKRLTAAQVTRARGLADQLYAYVRRSFDGALGDDLSVTQRLRAEGLDFDTVKDLVTVVLVGATELVIYGLPRALAVLIDSGAFDQLRAAPDMIDSAIDEALRVTTPSNVILRSVAADCVVEGHRFRQGDRVLIAFRNIMRRADRFTDPDRFVLGREMPPELRRLPFGAGPHTCLGAALTLAEMRQLLGMLIALPGGLKIGDRAFNRGKLYPGYTRLMISPC
ncbi:MAG: cytochrome P450 [Sphingomonas sp.]|nr:cytochrome P450 [Sphingomonas sp.]